MISTAELTGENICFPFARQGARLLRQTQGRKDEEVILITSASPERLDATKWLQANREGWGIESGLHQRLDISYDDDRSRVQSDQGMLLLGVYRRVANSLFMEWRSRHPKPRHLITSDFQTVMAENHRSQALRFVLSKRPTLNSTSWVRTGVIGDRKSRVMGDTFRRCRGKKQPLWTRLFDL